MLLFLDALLSALSKTGEVSAPCGRPSPVGVSTRQRQRAKAGNGRNIMVRTQFMLGIICDQVLIQASETVCPSMNFFSESRQVFFGRMLRNGINFSTRYRP